MEGKKISFGFMKTKKADKPPLTINNEEKKEYIECVEEKSIKVVGGEEEKTNAPLVIPLKPNTLIMAERLKEIAEKVESALNEPEIKQEPTDDVSEEKPSTENETLDQMAIRELMQQAKKEVKTETPTLAIPTSAKTVPEGEKESTLDDYEAVPIQQFGMAMLRGMGWTPSKDGAKHKQPELRPKGLGLGADKVIKEKKKQQESKDGKSDDLAIVTNSFVKVTTGKFSGYYGKVISLDEDNGRVMIDIPVKKETVSLSEFMMQAVTKSEYDKESKVINADSYQEYKKKETSQKSSKHEDKSSSSQKRDDIERDRRDRPREVDNNDRSQRDSESANGRSRNRQRRDSSSSEDRSSRKKKKDKKRYSSNDSLSSLSEDERRQHKHSKHKSRRRRSRSRSASRKRSRTPEGKRDIDKKRKGKKKKRDRDRSPNYKKHRK